jgi:hypothetical protein
MREHGSMVLRVLAVVVAVTLSSVAAAQTSPVTPAAQTVEPAAPVEPAPPAPAAEPTPAPGEPTLVEKMTMGARNAARDGRCDALVLIGNRVRELDASYYRDVFAVDPVITACVPGRAMYTPSAAPASAAIPSGAPPSMTPPMDVGTRPRLPGDYKSPSTALALSLGITGGGLALAFAAGEVDGDEQSSLGWIGSLMIAIGPTTGHIYADNGWNTGLKWRLGSLGIATGALIGALAACPPFSGNCNEHGAEMLLVVFVGAGVTYIGATAYEIGTAGRSARMYNERGQPSVSIAPIVGREPGVAVIGRF